MIGREFKFHDGKKGAALAIRINTGADESGIRKVLKDGTVVVDVTGVPEDPKLRLIEILASELKMERDRFDIIEGKKGVDMLLSILDIEPMAIQKLILEKIQ